MVLPRVKSARKESNHLRKSFEEKGSAEGNTVVIADQKETGGNFFLVTNM